jgi:hypothetical protein
MEKKKEITIKLSEKDMDAIEDKFFCEITEKQYSKIRPRLVKIWGRLCDKMDSGRDMG